jgi:hypothetical protein
MIGEVIQWVLLVTMAFFLLGLLRRVAIMLPPPVRAPSSGPAEGTRLPRNVLSQLIRLAPQHSLAGLTVAFVAENCQGCQRLLASLAESVDSMGVVLVAKRPSPQFRQALDQLDVPTLFDDSGRVWEQSKVSATPLVVRLDEHGVIVAREVTHRVDKVELP